MKTDLIITPDDITNVMDENGFQFMKDPWFFDSQYVLPTKRWMEREFSTAFWKMLFSIDAAKYEPETNDCEDFSLGAMWYAKRCNRIQGCGVAVGMIQYKQDDSRWHMRCFAICEEKKVWVYEPQLYQFQQLSETEKKVCYEFAI